MKCWRGILPTVCALVLMMPGCSCSPVGRLDGAETTLSNPDIAYRVPPGHYVVLRRGPVEAVVADNHAIDDEVLPEHQAGYSGLASLKHQHRPQNLFVPRYAGLNFEHIHDGRTRNRTVLFEPRHAPMELRQIDAYSVELYQLPTPQWQLESCHRYALLQDGTIELTVEFIPRRATFENRYVGLFWASYIDRPASGDIFFRGVPKDGSHGEAWIRGVTPRHGVSATHRGRNDQRVLAHDPDFPLTLVFNESPYRYTKSWYFGISHEMAWIMMFRPQDRIRFSQSPSGGGQGNPAWDFQAFISPYQVGQLYRLVTRAMYMPFVSTNELERAVQPHLLELAEQD